ncbi:MAG TPA: exodeoxyribonuclease VII large subunit [Vicinamibacterales bacterium]|jgi:exodeoxyribonuclease VII large subunit|nr:exodeoxyribonuclease VII large subunit [Vicinamibacterales bacterium]
MSDLFDLPFEEEEPPLPPEPDEPRPRPPAPARRVLSVTELTVRVRDLLETEFGEIWVEGELSNCRAWNTGHLYFTLKDESTQVRGVIFRSALRYLKFKPADGVRVIARGKITVYEPKGEYQIVCEHMEPQGLGALQLAFDQLKKRLQAEGLFDAARKRPLPALPRKIGVVTSLDGAAIRDIVNVLRRRYTNVHVVIRPARVQGEDAAADITQALRQIVQISGVDVVIVGRGGGSIEDLWAFNEERVARAIARCPVPVISAVGHETDFTIADFVADVRAATPSAAAELVLAAKDNLAARIDGLRDRLHAAARGRMQSLSRRVHVIAARPAFAGFPARVAMRGRHVADLAHALVLAARARVAALDRRLQARQKQLDRVGLAARLAAIRTRLVAADAHLGGAVARRRHQAEARLAGCAARLETLSPLAVLGRGYAVAWNSGRTAALRDAAAAAPGDRVHVTLHRGELECVVDKVHEPEGSG